MALVVELSEDQLSVGAIHRTVSGLPDGFDLVGSLAAVVRRRPGRSGGRPHARCTRGHSNSLARVSGGQAYLLLPHFEIQEQVGNDLDSTLIATVLSALPPHEVMHRHSVSEAMEALRHGEGQAAFLPRPGYGQADRGVGQRTPPHAAQDHLLQPKTADRHGVPVPRPPLR